MKIEDVTNLADMHTDGWKEGYFYMYQKAQPFLPYYMRQADLDRRIEVLNSESTEQQTKESEACES